MVPLFDFCMAGPPRWPRINQEEGRMAQGRVANRPQHTTYSIQPARKTQIIPCTLSVSRAVGACKWLAAGRGARWCPREARLAARVHNFSLAQPCCFYSRRPRALRSSKCTTRGGWRMLTCAALCCPLCCPTPGKLSVTRRRSPRALCCVAALLCALRSGTPSQLAAQRFAARPTPSLRRRRRDNPRVGLDMHSPLTTRARSTLPSWRRPFPRWRARRR